MIRPQSDEYLTCPECEEPCTDIPPAECRFICLGKTEPTWNEDQEGVCECGAEVYVFITGDEYGDYAELRVREKEEG